VSVLALAGAVSPGMAFAARTGQARAAAASGDPSNGCTLGNGVKHVIQLVFDNVHFFRDNPNVPSDLQMMPSLLQYVQNNGTWMSNNHTPLIAHTADDILTTATGLYGDRQGMPVSNSYRTFNPTGTTDPAGSFAYWTDPVFDTASSPTAGHDTNPSMVYASAPPATAKNPPAPDTITPAPWVPYTRSGCDVGEVATANQELENTAVDLPKVFGAGSPEVAQLTADGDRFKDAEVADYVGIGVHCAKDAGSQFCSTAQAVKFGQTTPSPTAVDDLLPNEPGGYNGFQALFGHRYVAPQLGAGTPDLTHNGFAVTNDAGNLVDLNGNEIDGAFLSNHPGFPGFGPINASQTLAYMSDMLEAGLPVVNGYIADIHGNEGIPGLSACVGAPPALGPGSACYIAQAQYYNQAFAAFFQRLAADGITPQNSLFVITSDEGDHVAGANVGRAIEPTPANCDGATVSGTTVTPDTLCTYPAGSFGELAGNLTGLLATEKGNTTPFALENDSAPEFYVTGNPGPTAPADPWGQLAGRVAAARDSRYVAGYTLQTKGRPARTVTVTIAGDGSWLVTIPGGALGGTADVAVAATPAGLYECALGAPTNCVRVGNPDGALPPRSDPRVYHVFTDWLRPLGNRDAAISVDTAAPLPGARGQCFSIEPNSAALASPVDPGVYCYDDKGTLTAAALPLGTLTLASAPAPAPPTVVLPGPVVPGTPLGTAAPPPSPSVSPSR